jgi:hypothetical protein
MTFAERLQRWNNSYDALPEDWRFQAVLWPLILLGAINMGLTVAAGFPFGLLVMLALFALVVIRVPYVLGWVAAGDAATGGPAEPKISINAVPWVYDLNLWYDGLPETRRPWVILAVLAVAGGLNMMLTIHSGFAFGILFLLALLAIVLIRAPYVAGWLIPPTPMPERITTAPAPGQIAQETTMVAPMHLAPAEPAPIEATPVAAAPIESAPFEVTPIEAAPVVAAPVVPPVIHEEPPPHDKPV